MFNFGDVILRRRSWRAVFNYCNDIKHLFFNRKASLSLRRMFRHTTSLSFRRVSRQLHLRLRRRDYSLSDRPSFSTNIISSKLSFFGMILPSSLETTGGRKDVVFNISFNSISESFVGRELCLQQNNFVSVSPTVLKNVRILIIVISYIVNGFSFWAISIAGV